MHPRILKRTKSFSITMPVLQSVNNSFVVQANENFDCGPYDDYKSKGVFKNAYVCQGKHSDSTISGTIPSGSGRTQGPAGRSKSGSSGLSTGAKAGIGVGVSVSVLSLLGLGAFILLHRRKKGRKGSSEAILPPENVAVEKDGFEKRGSDGLTELDSGTEKKGELGVGNEAQELPGSHGISETGLMTPKIYELPGSQEKSGYISHDTT
jgi:hypothetical protein